MSVQALSHVFDHSTVQGHDRLVLLALANHAGRDDWECWPSIETIAREAGMQPRSAQRHLRSLADAGVIEIEERGAPDMRVRGGYRPNLYRIVRPEVSELADAEVTEVAARGDRTGAEPVNAPHIVREPSVEPSPGGELVLLKVPTEAEQVFTAWVASTGRTGRTVLDPKRSRIIRNALRQFELDEVIDAVTGVRFSPFHMGQNDRHTAYNDLHHILGEARKIEMFRDLARGEGPTAVPTMTRSTTALAEWARATAGRP